MRPAVKLAGFAVIVAAAFGVGAAIGTVAGPIEVTDEVDHAPMTTVGSGTGHGGHGDAP